jgi:ubiquinone/menaquinone biosynthesis C-methylase UbiE
MKDKFEQYAKQQRKFWNTPTDTEARFARVDTISQGSEENYLRLAERAIQLVFEAARPKEDWALLEIGCGVGRLINQMQQQANFHKLYGVDISEKMIEFCRKNVGADQRISLHVNSGYDLSVVPDVSINFAYSVDMFIHIYDVDLALNYLREVGRVLKPGGLFRFNVRGFNPDTAFANTPGGIAAKLIYKLGLKSMGAHRWSPNQAAEFNGNQYTEAEIRKVIAGVGMIAHSIRMLEDGHIWCTARKNS